MGGGDPSANSKIALESLEDFPAVTNTMRSCLLIGFIPPKFKTKY